MSKLNFLCFNLCPLPYVHSLDTTEITIKHTNNANINTLNIKFKKVKEKNHETNKMRDIIANEIYDTLRLRTEEIIRPFHVIL